MKQSILYIIGFLLLTAGAFRAEGQELRSQPGDLGIPQLVTVMSVQNGSYTLTGVDANNRCQAGETVTIIYNPSTGYGLKTGYPKVYKTGNTASSVTVSTSGNSSTFEMPACPVTVEVQYGRTAAALTNLSYQVNGGTAVTVSTLPEAGGSVSIELPWNTPASATISFTATCSAGATVSFSSVTLSGGSATAAITVTAEDGSTKKTYTFNFTTQKQITESMVTLSATSFTYNGLEQKPTVTVKDGEKTLEMGNDKDYTLEWSASIKDVNNNYQVTVKPTGKSGKYGGNNITKTFSITKKALTVKFSRDVTKEYDGSTDVKNATLEFVSGGVVSGDNVSLNTPSTLAYADKNVGTDKAITVSNLSLAGNAAGNYSVTTPTNLKGAITKKALTVQFKNAVTKVYDGTTDVKNATLEFVSGGVVNGDMVSLNTPTLAYTDMNVGTDKNIAVSNLSLDGTEAGYYSLEATATLSGIITVKTLTVTPDPEQVVYADEKDSYAPSYKVEGLIEADKDIPFTGQLKVDTDGKIVKNDLSAGSNYAITVTDVAVTLKEGASSAAEAIFGADADKVGNNGWYKGEGVSLLLKAPDGFLIKKTVKPDPEPDPDPTPVPFTSQQLRAEEGDDYQMEFSLTAEEGEHTVYYQLKRNIAVGWESDVKSATYKLDASLPEVVITPGREKADVTLKDAVSGLASCTYHWDQGTEQTLNGIVSGSQEASFSLPVSGGKHTLSMTLTDMAGNQLVITDREVQIESTPSTPPPVDLPVTNATVSAGTKLTVSGHTIRLEVDRPVKLYIVTLSGRLCRMQSLPAGDNRITGLPEGVYIVVLDDGTRAKVVIR